MTEIYIVYVVTRDGRRHAMQAFGDERTAKHYLERCVRKDVDQQTGELYASAAEIFDVSLYIETMEVER